MSDMDNRKQEVTVVDIKMPFMSMVIFMVKFAIASIPAMIILGAIFLFLACYSAACSMVWAATNLNLKQ